MVFLTRSIASGSKSLLRQPRIAALVVRRTFATVEDKFDPLTIERDSDEVDVCIVGGGPAGLSAAIRLKQLEAEHGKELRVVVLEKGAEIGASFVSSPKRCIAAQWSTKR